MCILFSYNYGIDAATITDSLVDIHITDWFYSDVSQLLQKGIIDGYEDHTFRPDESVSVAEFIKMALVASGTQIITPQVEVNWYLKYVDTAILNEFIDVGYFQDYMRPITRGEMGNIIDRILQLRYNNSYEFIPLIADYSLIPENQKLSSLNVFIAGIITGYNDRTIRTDQYAKRSEAATVIIRMIDETRRKTPELGIVSGQDDSDTTSDAGVIAVTKAFSVSGIQIGMSRDYVLSQLGKPTEILGSSFGYSWYVYADDYSKFKMIGIASSKVVAIYTDKQFDSTLTIQIGTSDTQVLKIAGITEYSNYYYLSKDHMNVQFFSEKGVADGIEGILIQDDTYIGTKLTSVQEQKDMERVLFYLTNSTRRTYDSPMLNWSLQANISAYKHSKDMAEKEYFSHTTLDGVTFKTRMQNEGISATLFAENIAAGLPTAFDMHYALLHSDAHKVNIINPEYNNVGMGIYYLAGSKYGYYVTQNYFKMR